MRAACSAFVSNTGKSRGVYMKTKRSDELFAQAGALIPGGVNSPVRACISVECNPLFIASGSGSHVTTVDGQELIDYVLSWGPMLLGHAHPAVTRSIVEAAFRGTSYGAPCEAEVELAREIVDAFPGMDMVRMVNSGTEATMSALRLARAVTGRNKLLKFIGCYHGHADPFLVSAGSGVATLSIPNTPGVPETTVQDTLLAPYNDCTAVEDIFHLYSKDLAAVIVEPVAGNMGLVLPEEGFLKKLRSLCDANGTLLILDEVITGFRMAYGGAQTRFGVTPDLTTLGKIIGGGLPVGAFGGKAEYMRRVAPAGDVYQAGTLSGNPLAMAAGLATLKILKTCDYVALEKRVAAFAEELDTILKSKKIPVQVTRIASMFTVFFTEQPLHNFEDVKTADVNLFAKYYKQMREQNVYLAPSGFEVGMVSFAHSDQDFEETLKAAKKVKF